MTETGTITRAITAGMVVRGDRVWIGTRAPVLVTVERATGGYRAADSMQPDEVRQARRIAGRLTDGTARNFRRPFAERLVVDRLVTDD